MASEIFRQRHHELDLKVLLLLVDIFLVHHKVCEALANLDSEADLLEWQKLLCILLHELECRILRAYRTLFTRVLARIDHEVERLLKKLHDAICLLLYCCLYHYCGIL